MKNKHGHLCPLVQCDSGTFVVTRKDRWWIMRHLPFFETMPSGLLLYKLQTLACGSVVANWVEGMILYGISGTTLWSQRHKNPLPPTTL